MSAAVDRSIWNQVVAEASAIVNFKTGIQLGAKQTSMIESRLTKRMMDLGLSDPAQYLAYIRENMASETTILISLLTTHHTYFFREFQQFEALEKGLLKDVVASARAAGRKTIRIWSAACSRGQEVYTLAMFLEHHLKRVAPDLDFEILGSDVDPESVLIAKNGVYRWDEIKEIPAVYLANHWARGSGDIAAYVKCRQELRQKCRFETINLFDSTKSLKAKSFDLIFCRNVFIYFDQKQIQKLIGDLFSLLADNGFLMLGLSESIMNGDKNFVSWGPSIYRRADKTAAVPLSAGAKVLPLGGENLGLAKAPSSQPAPQGVKNEPLRVLCVDDSPTVLKMLEKIIAKDRGFVLVGTAENGEIAAQKVAELKPDVMTLDIHMPVMTGIQYLQKHFRASSHPAVVIVSSVSREDSELGIRTLELGASDYVEKPTLSNIEEKSDELLAKIRCAVMAKSSASAPSSVLKVAKSFSDRVEIKNPENKLRVVVGHPGDLEKLSRFVSEQSRNAPPLILLFQGAGELGVQLQKSIERKSGRTLVALTGGPSAVKAGDIFWADLKLFSELKSWAGTRKTSICLFGDPGMNQARKLTEWNQAQLLLEDVGTGLSESQKYLKDFAQDLTPWTSFTYLSDGFLGHD